MGSSLRWGALGEGNVQGALAYDDAAFDRLLTESIDRNGKRVMAEWGFGHELLPLTQPERRDVIAYVRVLAQSRDLPQAGGQR